MLRGTRDLPYADAREGDAALASASGRSDREVVASVRWWRRIRSARKYSLSRAFNSAIRTCS